LEKEVEVVEVGVEAEAGEGEGEGEGEGVGLWIASWKIRSIRIMKGIACGLTIAIQSN
jgi:hypothetical protein